jgi:hypothetical protein
LIVGLLAFYAGWAGSAIGTISLTVDEPLHATAAWNARFRSDYRTDREDPPLWMHWMGLFLSEGDIRTELTPAMWAESGWGVRSVIQYSDTLRSTDACDMEAMVRKARVAMLWVSVGLGVAIAGAAWRYAGPVGAVAATAAFAFEPLMLGHGVLAKNDVAFALCFFGAAVGAFEVCRGGGWWWMALLAVSAAVGMNVKFSGLLLVGAVVPVVLVARGVMAGEWRLAGVGLRSRVARVLGAVAVWGGVLLVTWGTCWASYGFRFRPEPGNERFDIGGLVSRVASIDLAARYAQRHGGEKGVEMEEAKTWQPTLFVRALLFAHSHKLLPESMVAGMLYTYSSLLMRPAFLCGEMSDLGFRWYFPMAWMFKTPVTLVVLEACALGFGVARGRRWWLLFLPAGMYVASAMSGRLNIGLRHLSPAYPFLMLGVGMFVAYAWRTWPRRWAAVGAAVGFALLAGEVLPQRLAYIQYFSAPFGGSRGGLALLSDSNLDWGQDLYRLIAWQRAHPEEKLFLCYFGVEDPARLGLRFENVNGSWAPAPARVATPGSVLAISATHLQGTFFTDLRGEMGVWRRREPIAVLGGTIYLYRVPK